MKLEVINNENNVLEFYMECERHSIPSLLKEKLIGKTGVDFVAYKLDHPIENKSRFILKGKNPKKLLETAVSELQEEIKDFKKNFEKIK